MVIRSVLIADSERESRDALLAAASALGLGADVASDMAELRECLASSAPELLLLDPHFGGRGAQELASAIREEHPGLSIAFLSGPDASADRLEKPSSPEGLALLLERVERSTRVERENEYLRAELLGGEEEPIVARSAAMAEALRSAARCARSRGAVLVVGEVGTGKRRLARHVHRQSPRAARPIVRIVCSGGAQSELEAQLFGGSARRTDGGRRTPALLELADGGTLLLEEVCDLPLDLQERLYEALHGQRLALGSGDRSVPIDLRVIATSRSDLVTAAAGGRFHPELQRLLGALPIHLRPLRERAEDVQPLAELFAKRAVRELGLQAARLSDDALEALEAWVWPGNVSELACVVRRAVMLCSSGEIQAADLGLGREDGDPEGDEGDREADLARRLANLPMAHVERLAILATLESAGGNKTEAARRLGLTARTLSNKLKTWRTQGLVA